MPRMAGVARRRRMTLIGESVFFAELKCDPQKTILQSPRLSYESVRRSSTSFNVCLRMLHSEARLRHAVMPKQLSRSLCEFPPGMQVDGSYYVSWHQCGLWADFKFSGTPRIGWQEIEMCCWDRASSVSLVPRLECHGHHRRNICSVPGAREERYQPRPRRRSDR